MPPPTNVRPDAPPSADRTVLSRLLSCGTDRWHEEEARLLDAAEHESRHEVLLTERRPGLTLEDAYRIQWLGAALRVERGAHVVGHKVGLTSAAMQQQIGITQPDSGILLDVMAVPNDGVISGERLRTPRVEAELAFRLGRDLSGKGRSEADALAAVCEVHIALEVIDSRFDLAGITLPDSVADNAGCARFVLGDAVAVGGLDLLGEELTVGVGARTVGCGRGAEILGDPIRSVVWLARHLAGYGAGLKAGDLVLAGAVHASIPLPFGQTVSATSPHLGTVRLHVG